MNQFEFIFLGVHQDSWMYRETFTDFIEFGGLEAIITSDILSDPLFSPPETTVMHMLVYLMVS